MTLKYHVDLNALEQLRDECARHGGAPGLYHAIRTPLQNPYAKQCPRADAGWNDFLGDDEVFEVRSYQSSTGRWQQSCYYGDQNTLRYFTGLAMQALSQVPISWLTFHAAERIPAIDRDHLLFAIYGLALSAEYEIPIDFLGMGPYAAHQVDREVLDIFACLMKDREREQRRLKAIRSNLSGSARRGPHFLYAALGLDVYSSVSAAIKLLLAEREPICGPDESMLLDLISLEELATPRAPTAVKHRQVEPERYTESEQLVLRTLHRVGHRLTRAQIQAEAGEVTSESTMKTVLAGLCRRGVIDNRQDVWPKGYGLTEWGDG